MVVLVGRMCILPGVICIIQMFMMIVFYLEYIDRRVVKLYVEVLGWIRYTIDILRGAIASAIMALCTETIARLSIMNEA